MALPTKPTDHTTIASTATGADITQPSSTLQTTGYVQDEVVNYNNLNWILKNLGLWEVYAEDAIDDVDARLQTVETDLAVAEGDIDDLETLTAGHTASISANTTAISSNTTGINAAAAILSAIVDLDETDDIMTFGNESVDYNKVVLKNDRGQVDITSTDIGGTNPAINETNIFNNKVWRKTYAFGASTNMSENGTRTPLIDYLALEDGYAYACKIRMDRVRAQGWPSSSEDAFADIYAQVIAGSMSISVYNDVIDAGVPSQWSQDVADILYLDATDDFSYFSNTIGLNALKLSTRRNVGDGPGEYAIDAFIGVNASFSGPDGNDFIQDRMCQDWSAGYGGMCGIRFLPGGSGIEFVTQSGGSVQSHGTALVQGTNYTLGPRLAVNGTSWTLPSDERLKTITGDIENSLDLIQLIKPVMAYYNTDEDKRATPVYIAQNIQSVLPNCVSENDHGFLGVQYEKLSAFNTQAIKDLWQEHAKLQSEFNRYKIKKEAEINDIKDKMQLLNTRLSQLEKTKS